MKTLGVLAVVVLALIAPALAGVRINLSASAPVGLWFKAGNNDPRRGDFVFACARPDDIRLGRDRGYIRWGLCPGGGESLVKQVAAVAGDTVTVTSTVNTNGRVWPQSGLLRADAQGRPLTPWRQNTTLGSGEYWLMSYHQPKGWDSRYLGPFTQGQILGIAVPIWTTQNFF